MAKDLRNFLHMIQREYPDLFMAIREEIDPKQFEITALLSLLEKKEQEKVVLFEKVLSLDGSHSFPFVSNLFFSRGLCSLALGLSIEDHHMKLVEEFAKREEAVGNLEMVSESEAAWK